MMQNSLKPRLAVDSRSRQSGSRFDWADAEYDFASILYQSTVPAEDRRRLGEYYTLDR